MKKTGDMTNDFGNDNWNNDEERMVMGFLMSLLSYMIAATVFAVLVCLCSGCSAKRVAVGESSVRVDTIYKVAVRADTLRVLDSVLVNTYVRGDTVFRDREVYRWREHGSVRVDTVYKTALRSDTIRVPVAAERRLSWWERNVEEPLGNIVRVLLRVAALVALLCGGAWMWRRRKNIGDE